MRGLEKNSTNFESAKNVRSSSVVEFECKLRHIPNAVTQALKETHGINPNQWPGVILTSSSTGFPTEWAFLSLFCLFDAAVLHLINSAIKTFIN